MPQRARGPLSGFWVFWRYPAPAMDDPNRERAKSIPTISARLEGGEIVEMAYRKAERRTLFLVSEEEGHREEETIERGTGERLIPYRPENNLIAHSVVLLPSGAEEYGTEAELVAAVRAFIHRYVDLSPIFEEIASYYVLFTWIHDAFNELPYLRVRGDFGSGKSRFLLTVGSLCYKPIFASGASTVSPIFRIIDAFRGTLVIDEGDFRASDEKAEITKILNNGNARGFPVLRTEVNRSKEFDPRAYSVFGPKLIATRGFFEDRALESRCLTENLGERSLRTDIPLNLPAAFEEEAERLRNRLLLFRFRNLDKPRDLAAAVDRSIEPRLAQIFAPLLSVIDDPAAREELGSLARRYHRELVADRSMDIEAQVLDVIRDLAAAGEQLSVKEIARLFAERHREDFDRPVTPKRIGALLRRKLGLIPEKSHGVFVVPLSDGPKLKRLYEKYGLEAVPVLREKVQIDMPEGGSDTCTEKIPPERTLSAAEDRP
jgi:hypothetical protein